MKAAVLGATGLVGRTFVKLLSGHPWFKVSKLVASEKSAGKEYGEIVEDSPKEFRKNVIISLEEFLKDPDVDIVFNALPASISREVEEKLAQEIPVFTNARAHRYDEDVPILVPEVNMNHLGIIEVQKKNRGWDGFIVTNPNCSTAILTVSLAPLVEFGIKKVRVATMQAISGAGFSGLSAYAIHDNVIPFINGEEWKIENESKKILGKFNGERIENADFDISAIATRVPVIHGHTEAVFVELEKVNIEEIREAFDSFDPLRDYKLPSYEKPIVYSEVPQPRLHRDRGKGLTGTVGRLEKINGGVKYVTLGHNLVRGAAGGSVLNAELAYRLGYL
ncbi:aspartate-semialdehyde dehydrogenase [Pyrococcus furiosus DSM 3638]|uniref:Aspartate-semialdehyde dehydrogenase n=3 Tax=Pyrococcus furiosus TaxID=2261 RepID=A0A5C0XNZ8_PYRFU|nr:aspartate-semialdehyde dehydrogenase [Pyrococcus furiosus]AAL81180.1 aspartate-semialdehyde dehydrogenase [Pyrococcus furiosus DSM 3638]AFN03852.1 aspartate-semialdehyde dehydrogenase [Pyrococcus furiosus COM1]QEK78717.1 aspartate-semialdehyde dehydrogenase [Pyrococcus furiosus DSM 3638]